MYQFVDANQLSPRLSATYKPFENTTFHAGYARYFTPPVLVEAAPVNIVLFNNTTGQVPLNQGNGPVLPERSHYFDAGVDQKIPIGCEPGGKNCSSLELGVDAYYKIAQDLIDNGQFGQALVLSAFNCEKGYNEGIEFHAKYKSTNFEAYANVAVAQQRATNPVSNQFLFGNMPLADLSGLTQFQYLQQNFIYTDHNQFVTASAGAIYQFCGGRPATWAETFGDNLSWCGTKLSADMIYGSGLRSGDANISTVPSICSTPSIRSEAARASAFSHLNTARAGASSWGSRKRYESEGLCKRKEPRTKSVSPSFRDWWNGRLNSQGCACRVRRQRMEGEGRLSARFDAEVSELLGPIWVGIAQALDVDAAG